MPSKIQRDSLTNVFGMLLTHHLRRVYLDNSRMAWNKENDLECFPAGNELHWYILLVQSHLESPNLP